MFNELANLALEMFRLAGVSLGLDLPANGLEGVF